MKDRESQRRSEVFDARGGEPQRLLLIEITNLKKNQIFVEFTPIWLNNL